MQTLIRRIEEDPVFQATASPYLVVDRNLMMRTMNPAYLAATERDRDELLDQYIFEVFPDNPTLPDADGVQNLNASLETVLRSNRRHLMRIQRYDIPAPTDREDFVLKYWSPVNSPVRDEQGACRGSACSRRGRHHGGRGHAVASRHARRSRARTLGPGR